MTELTEYTEYTEYIEYIEFTKFEWIKSHFSTILLHTKYKIPILGRKDLRELAGKIRQLGRLGKLDKLGQLDELDSILGTRC